MRHVLPAAISVLFLTGCAGTALPVPPVAQSTTEVDTPYKLTTAEIALVQEGTRNSLKDPESARFGQMVAGKDSKGATVVCLLVNAKNGYGGYTGMKPFMGVLTQGSPRKFIIVPSADSSQFRDTALYKVCRDSGLALQL